MSSKIGGVILIDGRQVADTKQCCHCGGHFKSVPGSGKTRGYCMNCNHITCGKPECNPCYPFEKKMDDLESGKIITL